MSSFLHSAIVAVFPLLSQTIAFGDDAKPPATSPELAAADQLYRAGKFAEAEAGYQGVLKNDSKLVPAQSVAAQVGLVRAMLRQQKIDEAFDAVNAALAVQPNAADCWRQKVMSGFVTVKCREPSCPTPQPGSSTEGKWTPILDWRGCMTPTLCIVKPMTSYRVPTRSHLTTSRCRGHGCGCFHEKRGWRHWRPTSAGHIPMMKMKPRG
jgi:hypothetical protein